ncbi:hypothetical protein LNV09_02100 [Paucibacter sp. B2R-40]|uniref:hypothetical protein n=1 Tax=Paucibacter sp. B2R-40 TaxID=2893554 RepID=UPI0021E421A2|nr:hypothetical protein [Paucibacter sp. B2R-40]MCV2352948.1 hypothetical protein [Paucibacter sp. B2R-40]
MFDSGPKSPKPPKALGFQLPVDARIETVFALLNQRPEFARIGAECVFARDEVAALLKLSGDPWTAAMLAELANARWQAEAVAESTRYDKVVLSLLGTVRTRDHTLRLMRRAVNRPIEAAMLQAQELLSRIQADKMPLTEAARRQMDENLLGLQSAWLLYSDRLLAAYMLLRDQPTATSAPARPEPASQRAAETRPGSVESEPLRRRHTDGLPTLH